MKLHFYKASRANIAVILRQGKSRKEWELILWDLDTDTFQKGQWLLNKQLDAKTACISPNGKYFAYGYDVYGQEGWQSCGVASKLPNFTAEYFCGYTGGRIWYSPHFDKEGRLVNSPEYSKKNTETVLDTVTWEELGKDRANIADSGYKQQYFVDGKGRTITAEEGKVFVDGEMVYDTTDHVFRLVEKM
jgi:hypothetical protein